MGAGRRVYGAGCVRGMRLVLATGVAAGVVAVRRVLDPSLMTDFVSLTFTLDKPDVHSRRVLLSMEPDDREPPDNLSGQVLNILRNLLGRGSFYLA